MFGNMIQYLFGFFIQNSVQNHTTSAWLLKILKRRDLRAGFIFLAGIASIVLLRTTPQKYLLYIFIPWTLLVFTFAYMFLLIDTNCSMEPCIFCNINLCAERVPYYLFFILIMSMLCSFVPLVIIIFGVYYGK